MAQNTRVSGSGTSLLLAFLALLGGAALAAALDVAENYGFVHVLPANSGLVALSYLLVGLITAAPVMIIRPASAAIPLMAALLAVPAFICGDMTYVLISSLWHHVSFDFFDYMRSYAEFQQLATIRLEVLAPATAGALAGLRLRQIRAAARPRGRHEAAVPVRSAALEGALRHAEVD